MYNFIHILHNRTLNRFIAKYIRAQFYKKENDFSQTCFGFHREQTHILIAKVMSAEPQKQNKKNHDATANVR